MKDITLVVPHDFTGVGQKALEYAIHLGKKSETEIIVIHLVSSQKAITNAEQKLNDILSSYSVSSNILLTPKVVMGDIFSDIGKIANNEGAQLVVMGTHGATGMQKIFGSFALKVIESTETPFLIVQTNTVVKDISRIAVYFDTTSESMQILNISSYIASITKAKLFVVHEKMYDMAFKHRINIHKEIIKESYDNMGLDYEFVEMEEQKSTLLTISKFIEDNDCDIIAIANYSEALIKQLDTFSQNLITNKQLKPCLIVNAGSAAGAAYF